jgi:hypothetical protein
MAQKRPRTLEGGTVPVSGDYVRGGMQRPLTSSKVTRSIATVHHAIALLSGMARRAEVARHLWRLNGLEEELALERSGGKQQWKCEPRHEPRNDRRGETRQHANSEHKRQRAEC